jgi:predicted RND superfamily exporter protein
MNAGLTLNWHDPHYELPSNWEQKLAEQDCVVWIDTEGNYDGEVLKQYPQKLVDARDHQYTGDAGTAKDGDEAISAIYTGVVPVVYKAQRTLLVSLVESTGWAFGMIAVVMIFVVRSVRAGLLSMLPNIFPVLVVFGVMGWSGTAVDIGSMMTASVAMGVAVDDTIHFLTWFRRGLDQGRSRQSAILLAYRRVGLAMTQTTAIGGLGLSIFAFSTFTPTQRFGTLMLALLAAALVGDLIFLPALLASPLGRVFSKRRPKRDQPPTKVLPDVAHEPKKPHVVPQPQTLRNRSTRDSA